MDRQTNFQTRIKIIIIWGCEENQKKTEWSALSDACKQHGANQREPTMTVSFSAFFGLNTRKSGRLSNVAVPTGRGETWATAERNKITRRAEDTDIRRETTHDAVHSRHCQQSIDPQRPRAAAATTRPPARPPIDSYWFSTWWDASSRRFIGDFTTSQNVTRSLPVLDSYLTL